VPVKLALLATQNVGFKHCRAWLQRFVELGAVRVDAEVIADARAMEAPPDVMELLEGDREIER
jgi:hypothetical protein